jgi:hypothetical protein
MPLVPVTVSMNMAAMFFGPSYSMTSSRYARLLRTISSSLSPN